MTEWTLITVPHWYWSFSSVFTQCDCFFNITTGMWLCTGDMIAWTLTKKQVFCSCTSLKMCLWNNNNYQTMAVSFTFIWALLWKEEKIKSSELWKLWNFVKNFFPKIKRTCAKGESCQLRICSVETFVHITSHTRLWYMSGIFIDRGNSFYAV